MGGRGGSGGAGKGAGVRYEQRPNGRWGGKIVAVDKATGNDIGELAWGGNNDIQGIDVKPSHRRQGIATAMYKQAKKATGGKLLHSPNRTDAGDAFARKVGGHVPPRSHPGRA